MAAFLAYRHPRTFRATTHVTELSNEEMILRYRFTNEGVEVLFCRHLELWFLLVKIFCLAVYGKEIY